jgi:hypothetical protein
MDKQLNALLGIDDSVMSVADAITQLRMSQAVEALRSQTPVVPTTTSFTNEAYASQLATMGSPEKYAAAIMEKYMAGTALAYPDAARAFLAEHPEYFPSYAKFLPDYASAGGGAGYAAKIMEKYASNTPFVNPKEAAAFITDHPELFKQFFAPTAEELAGFPKYATGGSHTGGWRVVGERGPELEYTKPSRIFSASESGDLLRTSELVAEIKALRADLNAGNYVIAKNTGKSAKLAERWDGDGLPETRTVT